jgi:sRNA-binding regulator protein Hfq
MVFSRPRHFNNRRRPDHLNHPGRHDRPNHANHANQPWGHQEVDELVHLEHTGSESEYLKSLIDSNAKVTVVMTDGERLQGVIRYYDIHCFSIGLSTEGPKIFLRKDSVAYIAESQE